MEAEHHHHDQQAPQRPSHHHSPEEGNYGGSPWVDMGGFGGSSQHHSPMHEYGAYGFGVSPIMPIEPSYSMSIPPPYTAHQQLQPLIMPQWPSMMAAQSPYSSSPSLPSATATTTPTTSPSTTTTATPIKCAPLPKSATAPTPATPNARRTLSDDDRRRMCQYHEDHPNVKQTEIGAMFGVERSTVSKVLRQKEKYLNTEDKPRSPVKKSKGKFPDIERALANWVRNHQRQGLPLTDAIIRDKARFFATTVGSNDSHQKVNSSAWLEKFKQKHNIHGVKSRKGSVDVHNDSDSNVNDSNGPSASQTPSGISPISPGGGVASPGAMTPRKSQESLKGEGLKLETADDYLNFGDYRQSHSHSATSMNSSVFSDHTGQPLSGGPISPASPYYSSEQSNGPSPYTPIGQARLPPLTANFRPRSSTFPNLEIEPSMLATGGDEPTPKGYAHMPKDYSLIESPLEDSDDVQPIPARPGNHALKRNHSTPDIKLASTTSMHPPPLPKQSSPISAGGSPTQDDARRALEVVWTFFQSQPSGLVVDPQEYMTIGKLMEKLKLSQAVLPGSGPPLPGGLHPIEEHVGLGLKSNSPRVSKKRSIHSL